MPHASAGDGGGLPCKRCREYESRLRLLEFRLVELTKDCAKWKENAAFEHRRWFDEFQRNDKLVKNRESLNLQIDDLRAHITHCRGAGIPPELIWEPQWVTPEA